MYTQTSEQTRTIWMDGRPHPPAYAPHSWTGFATGVWEGHILAVHTTHLKRAWLRVNGVPQSDAATVDEYFTRHGDRITYVSVVTDPVYLAEPWIRSVDFLRAPRDPASWLYACDDAEQIVGRPDDVIPSYPFGQHPYLREYAQLRNVPLSARSADRRPRAPSTCPRSPPPRRRMRSPSSGLRQGPPARAWYPIPTRATMRSMCGRCRAASTCSWAMVATSPCRSANRACSSSTPAPAGWRTRSSPPSARSAPNRSSSSSTRVSTRTARGAMGSCAPRDAIRA